MHGNGAHLHIPLEMNSEEEMQLAKVTHLEFAFKARLQLVDHIYIICQNDKVVYIHHNVVTSLLNI